MRIKYDNRELAADIRSLEGRGIDTDVAKELAEFKRHLILRSVLICLVAKSLYFLHKLKYGRGYR